MDRAAENPLSERHLDDEQVEALQRWIDAAKPIMRLTEWHITAAPDIPAMHRDTLAMTEMRDGADIATLHIGRSFWDQTIDQQKVTLTHELVHPHLYRLALAQERVLDQLGREARSIVGDILNDMIELACDRLAHVIAPLLPAPEIPQPKEEDPREQLRRPGPHAGSTRRGRVHP